MRWLFLSFALITTSACGKGDKPPPPTTGSKNAKPESGPSNPGTGGEAAGNPDELAKAMFRETCAICHGVGGKGDGQMAANLNPKPRDYTDPAWQASVTDEQIKTIIMEGGQAAGKSATMPAMKSQLQGKPEVLDGLVRLIRGFGPKK
ncbi:MAG: c-type cytochrome [Deltaproteobacteria bacterium]|nr:c-type cytochrome [Deltaproteobacteria bacterium]